MYDDRKTRRNYGNGRSAQDYGRTVIEEDPANFPWLFVIGWLAAIALAALWIVIN